MADTQQQTLQLTGTNEAQNSYLNYYNQILSQLGSGSGGVTYNAITDVPQMQAQQLQNARQLEYQQIAAPQQLTYQAVANPQQLQAQNIQAPSQLVAQTLADPEKIQVDRINMDRLNYGETVAELDKYLSKYLDNSIAARRAQSAIDRANADADAYSRGMGSSTYLSDQKNRMAASEAADIMAARNSYLANLGQQAMSMWDANEARWLNAEMQNQQLAYNAAAQNIANQLAAGQFNANALMNTDQFNAQMAYNAALQNANMQMSADQYNISNWLANQQFNAQNQLATDQYNISNLLAIAQANAANQLAADQFNISNEMSIADANAARAMQADQFNISNLIGIAQDNAANQLKADMYNADLQSQLQQLAWAWAQQMYGLAPIETGGGGGGGGNGGDEGGDVTGNLSWMDKLKIKIAELANLGYKNTGISGDPFGTNDNNAYNTSKGGSKNNNFAQANP